MTAEETAAYQHQYYLANIERKKENDKKYYEKHKEERRIYFKQQYKKKRGILKDEKIAIKVAEKENKTAITQEVQYKYLDENAIDTEKDIVIKQLKKKFSIKYTVEAEKIYNSWRTLWKSTNKSEINLLNKPKKVRNNTFTTSFYKNIDTPRKKRVRINKKEILKLFKDGFEFEKVAERLGIANCTAYSYQNKFIRTGLISRNLFGERNEVQK